MMNVNRTGGYSCEEIHFFVGVLLFVTPRVLLRGCFLLYCFSSMIGRYWEITTSFLSLLLEFYLLTNYFQYCRLSMWSRQGHCFQCVFDSLVLLAHFKTIECIPYITGIISKPKYKSNRSHSHFSLLVLFRSTL